MVRTDYLRMEITDRWKMNHVQNGTGWMNGGFFGQMDRAVQKGERICKISDRRRITVGMMR